jgi:hypothetical protein
VGGTLTNSGSMSNGKTIVNGAVLFGSSGGSPVASGYSGTVAITYNADKATVADLVTGQNTVAYGVTLKTFSNK